MRARVQVDWAALGDVLSHLSDDELTRPGPDGWAVKDHIAHIAEWERACTAVLQHRAQSEGFAIDEPTYAALDSNLDALNDILYQRHRGESISEVKDFAARAHADILAEISLLRDADLRRPVGDFGMNTEPRRPLIEKIAGDSYAHYAEHTTWIGNLIDALRG